MCRQQVYLQLCGLLRMCSLPPELLQLLLGWQTCQLDSSVHPFSLPPSCHQSAAGPASAVTALHTGVGLLDRAAHIEHAPAGSPGAAFDCVPAPAAYADARPGPAAHGFLVHCAACTREQCCDGDAQFYLKLGFGSSTLLLGCLCLCSGLPKRILTRLHSSERLDLPLLHSEFGAEHRREHTQHRDQPE